MKLKLYGGNAPIPHEKFEYCGPDRSVATQSAVFYFGDGAPDTNALSMLAERVNRLRAFPLIQEEDGLMFIPGQFLFLLEGASCVHDVYEAAKRKHIIIYRTPRRDTLAYRFEKFLRPIKYSLSSFLSFLVDYAVYLLLGLSSAPLWVCVYGARVVSALFNYFLNRRYVFYRYTTLGLLRHFTVVGISVTLNYFILQLIGQWGWDQTVAKPFVDLLLFFFGFVGEKFFVFGGKGVDDEIR